MKRIAIVVAFALAAAQTPKAEALLIDNFNSGGGVVMAAAGGSDSDGSTTDPGDALGDHRSLMIPGGTPVTGLGMLAMRANPVSSGLLTFSLEAMTSGSGVLVWDADGAGLGGVDLTDGGVSDQVVFDILSIDQGLVDLILMVEDVAGAMSMMTVTGAGTGAHAMLFTEFVGSANLAEVDRVKLEIRGVNASDLMLNQIETRSSVPEPASMTLLALGAAGLVRRRRVA